MIRRHASNGHLESGQIYEGLLRIAGFIGMMGYCADFCFHTRMRHGCGYNSIISWYRTPRVSYLTTIKRLWHLLHQNLAMLWIHSRKFGNQLYISNVRSYAPRCEKMWREYLKGQRLLSFSRGLLLAAAWSAPSFSPHLIFTCWSTAMLFLSPCLSQAHHPARKCFSIFKPSSL